MPAAPNKNRNPFSTDNTKYAVGGFLITPSDSAEFSEVTRAISFAAAGTIVAVFEDGTQITIPSAALAAGILHPLGLRRILATGTSATGIVGYV